MDIRDISSGRYLSTIIWAILGSLVIVGSVALLGRAARNITAALTDRPDLAVYLLLPDEEIGEVTLLREDANERAYLADTKEGFKMITLKKDEASGEWYVADVEQMHEQPQD